MDVMNAVSRVHGGADARGAPRWDFSTCANAAGPCPAALASVQAADATRYPDPAATAVRQALAALHGVEPWRVLPAASASEFIQRITAVTARLWPGAVRVPRHAYGDYAAAALAWGRPLTHDGKATLHWHAEPSSPLGQDDTPPEDVGAHPAVLDAVYAPLRLEGHAQWSADVQDAVFVLHSPNKALGLTGVRGAYAVAPRNARYDVEACCHALESAAPSWPLSAQADALLASWATAEVRGWVARSRATLAPWKAGLQRRLLDRGFELRPSVTPFFVVRPPRPVDPVRLRGHGVAVRDAASFGLAGCWRVSAQPPEAQDALMHALGATS
jgi:histidinol-phosphate aminotransferase